MTSPVHGQVAAARDLLDTAGVTANIGGLDALVNAINAGKDIPDTIENADVFPTAARVLLTALERHPATRLIIVGGAGSLELEPGLQVVDADGFADRLPATLGVPKETETAPGRVC